MKKLIEEATIENVLKSIQENRFNRIGNIKDFVEALDQIEENMFISLDAKWGAGKTFYVRQVEQTLKYLTGRRKNIDITDIEPFFVHDIWKTMELNYTYFPIYYDAWLYDNHDDPLMSLILLVAKECGKFCDTKLDTNSLGEKIAVLLDSLSISIGCVSIGGNFNETRDVLQRKDILSSVKSSEEIRECVKKIFDDIIKENVDKLVIFIDELDRCRPNFAIEMLERIKHYFDDDRIIFIASINREQLTHSISKYYGNDFDSTGYLDKFFDKNVYLPEIDMRFVENNLLEFTHRQFHLQQIAGGLNTYYRLSLRENLRFYECISYAASQGYVCDTNGQGLLLSAFVPIIAILNIKDENKKRRFMQGDKDILGELFKNVPALYQVACRFGGETIDKTSYNIGYTKIEEVYDYVFGIGEKKWHSEAIEIAGNFKSICIGICNGFGVY